MKEAAEVQSATILQIPVVVVIGIVVPTLVLVVEVQVGVIEGRNGGCAHHPPHPVLHTQPHQLQILSPQEMGII